MRTLLATALAAASVLVLPGVASAQCGGAVDTTLTDGTGFVWDVQPNGSINNGSIDAYDVAFYLVVGGVAFPDTATRTTELSGRQIVRGPTPLAGLQVTRRVYVPATTGLGFVRYLESFTNTGASPVTVTVRLQHNAGSDSGTVITGSFSGDTLFQTTDRWVTSDDSDGVGDPATAYNFGAGAAVTPSAVSTVVFDCAAPNGYQADFPITVPAGRTVNLLHFGAQATLRSTSQTIARAIDAQGDVYLAGLSTADLAAVANWRFCDGVDRDGDGQSCLAGDCNDSNVAVFTGAPERCDRVDNNCNGTTDEGFDLAGTCSSGLGACARSGTRACASDGASVVCSATAGTPGDELCGDSLDNDCDGMTDEGFALGMTCSNGVGACRREGRTVCSADRRTLACDATPGPRSTELCDGMDNDCNGTVDDGFDVGTSCTAGVGGCQMTAMRVCTADGTGTRCPATAGAAGEELCGDMIDNDCDGMTDEGFDVGMACEAGTGACRVTGMRRCTMDRRGAECSVTARMSTPEVCDGVDNDCNGMTDEGASLCAGNMDGALCVDMAPVAFCGCRSDADCGDTTSGRVCDPSTRRCRAGCTAGELRNGCPTGQFCTTNTPGAIGACTMFCSFDAQCTGMGTRNHCEGGDGGTNRCVECGSDTHCAARTDNRTLCIGPDNTCAECNATMRSRCLASGNGSACLGTGLCGCSTDADCAADRQCNVMTNRCEARPRPDAGPDVPPVDVPGPQDVPAVDDANDASAPIDASPPPPIGGSSAGCGCHTERTSGSSSALSLLGLAALAGLRRRRTPARQTG